ncbi:MAG: hypothetical protein JW809_17395 [Pirellulales bacterium]|nr:hypothetical protein [Pirellulales bacterium]
MTNLPEPPDPASLDEQLVAYLDGELDEQSQRQFEAYLASDPALRARLEQMGKAWNMLDLLDRPEVDETFTETTLELVAVAAEEDASRRLAALPRGRRWRWATMSAGALLAAAVGFAAVALLRPDPDRRLLENLPVLEEFDEFRRIENVEFVRELRAARFFSPDRADDVGSAAAPNTTASSTADSADPLAARRERIRDMTPERQARLQENLRRFDRLDPDAKDQLRRIHRELDDASDAADLRAVMRRYAAWLSSLPMTTQGELAELPPDQRIERIKGLLDEQADARGLQSWWADYVPAMLRHLSEAQRERLRGNPEQWQRPDAIRVFFGALHKTDERSEALDKALADLRRRVSPRRAAWLAKLPPERQLEWVGTESRERFWQAMLARSLGGPLTEVGDEQLAEFFSRQSPETRDALLSLPSEEMYERLREMYGRDLFRRQPGPRGQRGGHPGGMPPGAPQGPPPPGLPHVPTKTPPAGSPRFPPGPPRQPGQ